MFIRTGHLHLAWVYLIIVVARALDSQLMSPFKTAGCLWGKLILLRSIKWVPGFPGDWVVKSKIFPLGGLAALRQLNPFHKKGP